MNIDQTLHQLADPHYQRFTAQLLPTLNSATILGVRTPDLRRLAKALWRDHQTEAKQFLNQTPHHFYEENNLHGFLIEQVGDLELTLELTEKFLPFIDNWATCDSFTPKIFKKHSDIIYDKIKIWLTSDRTYTVRYAIRLLLSNFLDEYFQPEMLKLVTDVKSNEYYIQMMQAWYLATALAKQEQATLPYLTNRRLSTFVHNKAIQKAIESRRISYQLKSQLRSLKIK